MCLKSIDVLLIDIAVDFDVLLDGAEPYYLLHANLGDNVTLLCFSQTVATYLSWYKQIPGEQPRLISTYYKSDPNSNTFHDEFHNEFQNKWLSVSTGAGSYHLKISNTKDSDSAAYYCAQTIICQTQFINGTLLIQKESNIKSFLQQPDAGTYYCAVASYGMIVFGQGTKVDVTGLQPTPRSPEYTRDNQGTDSDTLQYAALEFKTKSKFKRATRSEKDSVYSGVRL
ncbi:uncharacterized protein LOC117505411 [Thalassophryne amazonica]|uniref:uncharacterized protein LOC117505411 n=1 Tax=Thalassophryne amazonica TaxID=390379 RepID=UPI0014724AAD|nr:uncharacterized protein LOC117505411 [Thalassophryne amazonica]